MVDRRRKSRVELGRRGSDRASLFQYISWRAMGDGRTRKGLLVGASATGLAMLTERQETPVPGARILSGRRARRHRWPGTAVVTRIDRLSGLLDLVAAEYANGKGPSGRSPD